MKQAETKLGGSYPLRSMFEIRLQNGKWIPVRRTTGKRKFDSTFIYSRDRGQPGKPNPKTDLNK